MSIAGDVKLPTSEVDALAAGWKSLQEDEKFKLTWYTQENDPRFMLGYDGRQKLAGLRVAFLKSDVDPNYTTGYTKSGIFEEGTFLGKPVFYSTVLMTPEGVLRSGGRRSLPDDEIALSADLKRHGKFKSLPRDGCEAAQGAVVEQGCQSGYGLVFSKFGSKTSCDSLAPFYSIYDPEGKGNLIGFGYLSFSKFSADDFNTKTFYKTLSASDFKSLFPKAPSCLSSYAQKNGLTAIDVWLSYDSSKKASCSGSNWVDSHCQRKRSTRPGQFASSSDEFVDSEES
ncbi:hypothetical protein J6590_105511 [Homalodisca vitripennis]|nr:hypothetical protein J6590_105511 [Homalodisca vitripennis]